MCCIFVQKQTNHIVSAEMRLTDRLTGWLYAEDADDSGECSRRPDDRQRRLPCRHATTSSRARRSATSHHCIRPSYDVDWRRKESSHVFSGVSA